uniref:Abnormal cell migration protein 18-like fibronectin type I domain-containing protein n=1 Tax=Panagrolaimus superbus TaxID=310955 RepID=A0A914YI22_9BILA
MSMCLLKGFLLISLICAVFGQDTAKCDCTDWYGRCRNMGETWADDNTWMYACDDKRGAPATFAGCLVLANNELVMPGKNISINGFWYSCDVSNLRIKYDQEPRCLVNGSHYHVGEEFREGYFQWLCLETGRWVTGCYYQNETKDWNLLKIGEKGYNGLIQHVCDRYKENPGRIQYIASIRKDIPHKSPTNKGKNQNLLEFVDNRLKEEPVLWTHDNVVLFIESKDKFNQKIRYLPASRGW